MVGLARNPSTDTCVAITNSDAWVQRSPGSTRFNQVPLPVSAAWCGLTHDGNNFIAVASGANSNISIVSSDGTNWQMSTEMDNPGCFSIAGFNGRAVTAGDQFNQSTSRLIPTMFSGNPTGSGEFNVDGNNLSSQRQTNEYLMQEVKRLKALIEEKCGS
jgi:hypothetical protein